MVSRLSKTSHVKFGLMSRSPVATTAYRCVSSHNSNVTHHYCHTTVMMKLTHGAAVDIIAEAAKSLKEVMMAEKLRE